MKLRNKLKNEHFPEYTKIHQELYKTLTFLVIPSQVPAVTTELFCFEVSGQC